MYYTVLHRVIYSTELHTLSISHSWKVNEAEVANKRRRDLRDTHFIVSIDPKGCEDVDDALSVRYVIY